MASKKKPDWKTQVAGTLGLLVVLGVVFGIRLWMAGGDFECAIASDIGVCLKLSRMGEQ